MKYLINNDSYSFELIENKEGFFDESIDATFIIHLEGNGRLESVKNQLEIYKPSKKIFILHNKGFKKSKKTEYINNIPRDLIDSYLTIFKFSTNENYSNILILEDDFMFDEKILNKEITNDINKFINKHANETFLYYLGCVPYVVKNIEEQNVYSIISSLGTHSIIYSKKFIIHTLTSVLQKEMRDWDEFTNNNINILTVTFNRYLNKKCLCYQPFPETDNFKQWGINLLPNNFLTELIREKVLIIQRSIIQVTKLDTNPKEGFKLFYDHCIKL